MRKLPLAFAAAAALLAPTLGAQAQSVKTDNPLVALKKGELQTDYSQWRRGYRYGPRGYYAPRGYYGRPYYGRPYYGGYYRYDRGAAAAAGIAGLATGAIIGGALAQQQAAPVYQGNSAVAYCAQRYRSYDPGSGTYLGYDGLRHPCP